MPQQHFKDVTIGGRTFRVGRLTAADGAWLAVLLTGKMRVAREEAREKEIRDKANSVLAVNTVKRDEEPQPQQAQLSIEEGMLMTATFLISTLSRAELADVQMMCLSTCSQIEAMAQTTVPIPIIVNGNQWSDPDADFEHDGPTVLELTKASIAFNITPFFPVAGSSEANPTPADSKQ